MFLDVCAKRAVPCGSKKMAAPTVAKGNGKGNGNGNGKEVGGKCRQGNGDWKRNGKGRKCGKENRTEIGCESCDSEIFRYLLVGATASKRVALRKNRLMTIERCLEVRCLEVKTEVKGNPLKKKQHSVARKN